MSHMRMVRGLALAGLVSAFAAGSTFAQGAGGGGGGRRFDPAQMRQRMEQNIQDQLGVTDEEWKAIQPLVDNVLTLRMQVNAGGFGGMGRGRRGGGGGAPPGCWRSLPCPAGKDGPRDGIGEQGQHGCRYRAEAESVP